MNTDSGRAIHQLMAGFTRGDAISNESMVMRDMFRSWGFESDIFCEARRILPEFRREAHDLVECRARCRPDDIALLHLSIGSPANDVFAGLSCRKAILFHNVTPPHFFARVNRQIARSLETGMKQVGALAGKAEVTMADSMFNAGELSRMGYKNVRVLPIILDAAKQRMQPDRKTLRQFDDGLFNILFVGRCVPNKKIEDLLCAFRYFQKNVEPQSRLILVGSHAGSERYYHVLRVLERDLELRNVHFAGAVSQASLNACFESADLFLCMSEHEGFCIPLIESISHDVPVLAYSAAAVPETLDGAGVLFSEKNYGMIAEMMGRLVRDQTLRGAVVDQQRARLARYLARDMEAELRDCLLPLLPSGKQKIQ